MKKLLTILTLLTIFSANKAYAYGTDAESFSVNVTMASTISFLQQPDDLTIDTLLPGVAAADATAFIADGDDNQTLSCSFSGVGIDNENETLTLYEDNNSANSNFIEADFTTGCNDGGASIIMLLVGADDTTDDDIGKTFGSDGSITLSVAYI